MTDLLDNQQNPIFATGDHDDHDKCNIVKYVFGKYAVYLKLSEDQRFLGIEAISEETNFLSQNQRLSQIGHHDLDDIYKE